MGAYEFAQHLLPKFIFDRDPEQVSMVLARTGESLAQWFQSVWELTHPPETEGPQVRPVTLEDGTPAILLTMPEPEMPTHAREILICAEPTFTIFYREKGVDQDIFCARRNVSERHNFGPASGSLEAFAAQCTEFRQPATDFDRTRRPVLLSEVWRDLEVTRQDLIELAYQMVAELEDVKFHPHRLSMECIGIRTKSRPYLITVDADRRFPLQPRPGEPGVGLVFDAFQNFTPEGVRGLKGDIRTDFFRAGEILYSLEHKERLFPPGESDFDTLESIRVFKGADYSQTMIPTVYPHFLAPDPRERFHSVVEAQIFLKVLMPEGSFFKEFLT